MWIQTMETSASRNYAGVKQDLLFLMLNLTLVAWKKERDKYGLVVSEDSDKEFSDRCKDIGVFLDNPGEFSKKAALNRLSAMLNTFESSK